MIKLVDKNECTGCGACFAVCPKEAISFRVIGSLHQYPEIDDIKCIECGKCLKVCPQLDDQRIIENKSTSIYAAYNIDAAERQAASSGGVSGALTQYALENGFFICGAAFDDKWHLEHVISNHSTIKDRIRGSKYLYSDASKAIRALCELLKEDKKILFIGTPCQVDAVNHAIPRNKRDNIITCEILCHGVNSAKVWEEYIDWLSKKHKRGIKKYNFRSKSHGWGNNSRGTGKLRVSYELSDGKLIDIPAYKNLFHTWFGYHYILRENCFHCKYRTENRVADITIGDFWGVEQVVSIETQSLGVSAVLCNTAKGLDFVQSCNLILIDVDVDKTKQLLKGYSKPMNNQDTQLKQMKAFEVEYLTSSFDEMAKKYRPHTTIERIILSIRSHLHI